MTKTAKKPELISDIITPNETAFKIVQLLLKDSMWTGVFHFMTTLERSYSTYKVELRINEKPFLDRIEEIEADFKGSLFSGGKSSRRDIDKQIKEIRDRLSLLKSEGETISFNARVEELKYKDAGTRVKMAIPDDVIEAMNRQKFRIGAYEAVLTPVF